MQFDSGYRCSCTCGNCRGAGAQIVGAVDRHPRLHSLQILEQHTAIDRQIAHHRKLRQRLQRDRALAIRAQQLVHQRRARHHRLAVDPHRAASADLLQAVRVIAHRRRRLAIRRHRVQRNLAQHRRDIHPRPVWHRKALLTADGPVRLPLHLDLNGARRHSLLLLTRNHCRHRSLNRCACTCTRSSAGFSTRNHEMTAPTAIIRNVSAMPPHGCTAKTPAATTS